MTVPAVPESESLTLPHTGEIIDLADTAAVAYSLQEIRGLEARLREVKTILTDAVVRESQRQGSKTLHMGTIDAEVRGGNAVEWDAEELERGLRDAGMPDDRIRDVVKEQITYTVDAREAKRVAGANEAYAAVVARVQTVVEKKPYIVVRRA